MSPASFEMQKVEPSMMVLAFPSCSSDAAGVAPSAHGDPPARSVEIVEALLSGATVNSSRS
jgi:hypothetical protein